MTRLFIQHRHPAFKLLLPVSDTFLADFQLRVIFDFFRRYERIEEGLQTKHARGVGGQLGLDQVSQPSQALDVVIEPEDRVGLPVVHVHDPLRRLKRRPSTNKSSAAYAGKGFPRLSLQKVRTSIVLI